MFVSLMICFSWWYGNLRLRQHLHAHVQQHLRYVPLVSHSMTLGGLGLVFSANSVLPLSCPSSTRPNLHQHRSPDRRLRGPSRHLLYCCCGRPSVGLLHVGLRQLRQQHGCERLWPQSCRPCHHRLPSLLQPNLRPLQEALGHSASSGGA